jgi:hypothetical protein
VQNAGGDVPLHVIDRLELGAPRLDLGEGRGHELHDAARADVALRRTVEVALRHPLRLEVAPVVPDAKEPLRVLSKELVVARLIAGHSLREHRPSGHQKKCENQGGAH